MNHCLLCRHEGTIQVRNPTANQEISLCAECGVAIVQMLLSMFPDVLVHQIMVSVIDQRRGESDA